MRKVKDRLASEKSSSMRRDKESLPILSKLDKDNSKRSRSTWLNRLVLSVKTT